MRKTTAVLAALVVLVIFCSLVFSCASYLVRNKYTVTVTDKQVKRYEKKDTYLVFAKRADGSVRVFENTDSLLYWKFNSSDIFAKLEKRKMYHIKVYGWRVPFLSWYENIVSVEEVSAENER